MGVTDSNESFVAAESDADLGPAEAALAFVAASVDYYEVFLVHAATATDFGKEASPQDSSAASSDTKADPADVEAADEEVHVPCSLIPSGCSCDSSDY